jgi:glycine hydroxymethyltransferase
MAFELFVHPDRAESLFQKLLEVGSPIGLKPVGLGARDSLRTEAGLPLYGHEMGAGSGKMGSADLGVGEAGFGSYVKSFKPWFIGREAYLERGKSRRSEIGRFRFNEKGVRMAHPGDPVLEARGKVIGWVTSCAVDSDGKLTGQAYLDLDHSAEGTQIYIYQNTPGSTGKLPADFKLGDKTALPSAAVVLSRFPK